ncbi:3'(2'),5'-bisphosphate nucleotidase CysQ family protein [Sediminitomix flava]|uniref:3'(2'), 5'-bisphosphate nucleotidase n=1 Tax=Sediminitomix flava TaxID=379075 RepID=A0A315Z9N2_SEDFL|nr:inositol monophosphatase family protein [Sediminitomix flava]PWJ42275.1 3'(2'), 5'-bisphosphate nucleotidase [Sediminitomix flava]
MKLNEEQLVELSLIAQEATLRAGEIVKQYFQKSILVHQKEGGESLASQVFTEADIESQNKILEVLDFTFSEFDLGLLTEEAEDDSSRFEKDYFWCVDPLDGTLPFTEGKSGFSISVALVSKEGIPVIGVVYDPIVNHLYRAISGEGVYKNDTLWNFKNDKCSSNLSFYTDRSFLSHASFPKVKEALDSLRKELTLEDLEIIGYGGAVMNAIWALENHPACYFKFPKSNKGGGSLWDFAATVCIYRELGANTSDMYGKTLSLNSDQSIFMNEVGVLYATDHRISDFLLEMYKDL